MVALAVLATSPGSLASGSRPGLGPPSPLKLCERARCPAEVSQALVPVDLVVESAKLTTQEDELLRFGRESRTAALGRSRQVPSKPFFEGRRSSSHLAPQTCS